MTMTKCLFKKLLGFFALSFFVAIFMGVAGISVSAIDLTSTNFIIRNPIVGTGGGYGTSTGFKLISAGNITLSGVSSSASFQTRYGFLYYSDEVVETITFDLDTTAADTCSTTESAAAYTVALGTITITDTRVSGATDTVNNICVDLE